MAAQMEERTVRPAPVSPERREGGDEGPGKPNVERPSTNDLLKRMQRIDPDTARRYRQRSGE